MATTSPQVLIVEDSQQLADSLKDVLQMRQIDAVIATNGEEGVALAEKMIPALVLLDIRLPSIDGYEVFRRIKSSPWGENIDIVILTASESIDSVAKNLSIRPSDVLFKPEWSMRELQTFITNRLSLATQTATST